MHPPDAQLIADMREWANDKAAVVWSHCGKAILPSDVTSRPDDKELTEFLTALRDN